MKTLAEHDRGHVIDLLNERLAFEELGVGLYEAALGRVASSGDGLVRKAEPQLAKIRFEEHEHARWLERQLGELGASRALTPRTAVMRRRSEGIARVALDPASSIADVFDSLLAAELLDHAGWNLLINLAAELHDDDAQESLRERLDQENQHLHAIRTIVFALERRTLLGIETDVSRRAA
jgi:bacterioferritin (cytochrome b1)